MTDDHGFLRLARKFFRSDVWKEHREFSRAEAWLDMIATAAFAPETRLVEGRCLNLQRGELLASVRYLACRWSWSKSKVERFLSALVDAQRIRDRYETGTRVITLCNYESYNPVRDSDKQATGPPAGQSRDKVKDYQEDQELRNKTREAPAFPGLELSIPQIPPTIAQSQECIEWWGKWLMHLKARRKSPSVHAQDLQLRKLDAMGPTRAIAALKNSIEHNWQGIYEPANSNQTNGANNPRNRGLAGAADTNRAERILAARAAKAAQEAAQKQLANQVVGSRSDSP